jgi:hypothetical protein
MNSIFTPDRLITVAGLAISVVSLLSFRKMSRKLLGAVILALAIFFGAQTWFFLQFERSVDQARHAILQYISKDTKTELMISKRLTGSFDPTAIREALDGLQSEGIIKRRNIEVVHRGPSGDMPFEYSVYCNPKAQEQAGVKPFCD